MLGSWLNPPWINWTKGELRKKNFYVMRNNKGLRSSELEESSYDTRHRGLTSAPPPVRGEAPDVVTSRAFDVPSQRVHFLVRRLSRPLW